VSSKHHGYKVTQLIIPEAIPPQKGACSQGQLAHLTVEHIHRHRYYYVSSFNCIRKPLKAANRYAINPSYTQDYRSKIKENSAEEMLDTTSWTP
jgi:hypothetical protein